MQKVYIVAAKRSAIGSFAGGLSTVTAPALGAAVARDVLQSAGVSGDKLDEVIVGNIGGSTIFDYRAQLDAESMLNTPPSWNWYMLGLTVKWMLDEGGVAEFSRQNARKAALLYAAIDGSGGFYRNEVAADARSRMNVPFFLHDEALNDAFLAQAREAGLISLKGHRVLGGMRASIYNAMPEAGVQALADFMKDFQQRNG